MTKNKQPKVFFRNYDYAETEGVGGKNKFKGPGKGFYSEMDKYKSVADFLKKKRKEQKRRKMALLYAIMYPDAVVGKKYSSRDPYEDQGITPLAPISPAEVAPIGMLDGMYPQSDLEGRGPENLYYGILETHEYAADDGQANDTADYYKLGLEVGKEDLEYMGFGSDILAGASALLPPHTLDPNAEDYGEKLLEYARGYMEGSKMPLKGKGYGNAETELRILHHHIQQVKKLRDAGETLQPGQYIHP